MRNAPNGIRVLALAAVAMATAWAAVAFALPGSNGRFSSRCEPSHTRSDDPIVYPGKPGWSHEHQFFGARTTDAFSKPARLRRSATSCNLDGDTGAYWVPTLRVGERTVRPKSAQIYYDDAGKRQDRVRAFPPGLRMVAGNAGARRRQPVERASWYCRTPPSGIGGSDRNGVEKALFAVAHPNLFTAHPHCAQPGANLSLRIGFPDCWDGRNLDSGNHQSHVRYSRRIAGEGRYAACPDSHPVPMPALIATVHYPTTGDPDRGDVELSSGGIHSLHADFINSWDQGKLEQLVRRCINLALC